MALGCSPFDSSRLASSAGLANGTKKVSRHDHILGAFFPGLARTCSSSDCSSGRRESSVSCLHQRNISDNRCVLIAGSWAYSTGLESAPGPDQQARRKPLHVGGEEALEPPHGRQRRSQLAHQQANCSPVVHLAQKTTSCGLASGPTGWAGLKERVFLQGVGDWQAWWHSRPRWWWRWLLPVRAQMLL